jgi:hypothetical protein
MVGISLVRANDVKCVTDTLKCVKEKMQWGDGVGRHIHLLLIDLNDYRDADNE